MLTLQLSTNKPQASRQETKLVIGAKQHPQLAKMYQSHKNQLTAVQNTNLSILEWDPRNAHALVGIASKVLRTISLYTVEMEASKEKVHLHYQIKLKS